MDLTIPKIYVKWKIEIIPFTHALNALKNLAAILEKTG
jgi:hypothetical protein